MKNKSSRDFSRRKFLTDCAKIVAIGVFMGLAVFTSGSCSSQQKRDVAAVREKLESEWWKTFTTFNYNNICSRQWDDGFFEESPGGGYMLGFWPRACAPLTKMWLSTGEPDRAKRLIRLAIDVTAATNMGRVPHIISPAITDYRLPVEGSDVIVQSDMSAILYEFYPSGAGAQRFIAPDRPVIAVEAGFTWGSTGTVTATVSKKPDGEAIASVSRERISAPAGFYRFEFDKPVALKAGEAYYLQIKWTGIGPLYWMCNNSRVAAFAIDTGSLEYVTQNIPARAYSMADQIDGQAHVILGWALYANRSGDRAFVDETYEQVAELMNYSVRPPYMTGESALGNLIYNSNLEHSRENYFLTTYDMLAQSFIAQSLREMIKVAQSRGDAVREASWTESLSKLEAAIAEKMTWTLDGQKIYAEMYEKEMNGNILDGLSWVNLGITASGWEGVDEALYAATIAMYAKKTTFIWKGHNVLGIEYTGKYTDGRTFKREAIGKGIGWEMLFYAQRGNWQRVSEILDFVYDAHEGNAQRLYGESFHMATEDSTIFHQDPGNGEQVNWFLCCLFEVRRLLKLSALP